MRLFFLTCAAALLSGAASAATVIYDESTSGDLSAFAAADLGTITEGEVTGSLDAGPTRGAFGDGTDEQDSFSFTLTETVNFSLSVSNLVAPASVLSIFVTSGPPGSSGFSSASEPSTLDAGTYSFSLIPSGNAGSLDYTFSFEAITPAVPLPAGVLLYGPLLIGAGAIAARRRRRATQS
ncbi:MAG: hypothetical protein AAFS01_08140 [Pseudomonadota bacterium]